MEQLATDQCPSSRSDRPGDTPGLVLVEEDQQRLLHGGVLLPSQFVEDLNIPTLIKPYTEYIAGARVDFTIETPVEILDPIPVILAHGYCGFELAYSALRNALARNGKIAVTYNPPRRQQGLAGVSNEHLLHPDRLLAQSLWAVMRGVRAVRKDTGQSVDIYDLLGHSMGGPTSTATALRHPDDVRTVVLNESAGLENHNLSMMIPRLLPFFTKELLPAVKNREFVSENDLKVAMQVVRYILGNPYKTLAEGVAVGNCDIREKVAELSEYDIKTAVIVGDGDHLISADRTHEYSYSIPDLFARYADPTFNHLAPQIHPLAVAQAYAEIIMLLPKAQPTRHLQAA